MSNALPEGRPGVESRAYGEECNGCLGPTADDVIGFQEALRVVNGKWKIQIICELIAGPVRFGALRRALPGITQHMLSEQLRDLESNGVVIRRAYPEVPPRVEYELSQAGVELVPAFAAILEWSKKYRLLLART